MFTAGMSQEQLLAQLQAQEVQRGTMAMEMAQMKQMIDLMQQAATAATAAAAAQQQQQQVQVKVKVQVVIPPTGVRGRGLVRGAINP